MRDRGMDRAMVGWEGNEREAGGEEGPEGTRSAHPFVEIYATYSM